MAAVDRVPERASVQVVRELAVALKAMVRFDPARVESIWWLETM